MNNETTVGEGGDENASPFLRGWMAAMEYGTFEEFCEYTEETERDECLPLGVQAGFDAARRIIDEGAKAAYEDRTLDIDACPYGDGTPEAEAWEHGWMLHVEGYWGDEW